MDKPPTGRHSKPAPNPTAQKTDTVSAGDDASLAATTVSVQVRDDDVEADAASMLLDEALPAAPSPTPASQPKTRATAPPAPPAPPAPADAEQTAVFTQAPPDERAGVATNVAAGADTQAPKVLGGATGPPSSKVLQKTGTLGDYRLLKKLGAGGMGTVYLAEQISLERRVALKVLSKELAGKPGFVQRFQREARLMARLDHPNILRCHDVGTVAGHHYLAMEFVDGGSLQDWLKKLGKFSLGDALHVTLACARALQHAHELNMIHRDVKPDNILLTGKGIVKLADLGLAKASDDDLSLTKTGTGAGTPLYMAPEQARDAKHVDHRSDLYAVGCMLYCFLTGQLPFTGETLIAVIDAKTKGTFIPARRLNGDIPVRLDLIIDKTLAANPNHRYQSCAELVADLESLGLANERLSFLAPQAGANPPGASAPARPTPTRAPHAAAPTRSPERAAAAPAPADAEEDGTRTPQTALAWYIRLPMPGGKTVDKKVSREEIIALVKDGTLTPDTKVSRALAGPYRNASGHPDLRGLIQSLSVKASSDRKTHKYRELYAEIDQAEKERLRSKWLKKLASKLTGFVGLLIWMTLVLSLLAGGAYGVWWLIQKYGS